MAGAPEVTTAELAEARDAGALVVDVRTDDEWNAGHIPGALHVPLAQLGTRWEELPKDRRIYVVCAVCARSLRATEALIGAGLDAVNVAGGTKQWAEEGRPLSAD